MDQIFRQLQSYLLQFKTYHKSNVLTSSKYPELSPNLYYEQLDDVVIILLNYFLFIDPFSITSQALTSAYIIGQFLPDYIENRIAICRCARKIGRFASTKTNNRIEFKSQELTSILSNFMLCFLQNWITELSICFFRPSASLFFSAGEFTLTISLMICTAPE